MATEADSAIVTLENHAESVAEMVGESTEALVEGVAEHAEQLIEDANRRAETAEAITEALVEAAQESVILEQVEQKEENLWQALENLDARVTHNEQQSRQQEETISSLQSQLTELLSRLPPMKPAEPEPSTLPTSQEVSEALADPLSLSPVPAVDESPVAVPVRRRRLL